MGRVECVLEVWSSDRRYCYSLYSALEPDNVNPPENVSIGSDVASDDGCAYRFWVRTVFKKNKFDTLRGTIDEVLSIIEVIDEALTTLK